MTALLGTLALTAATGALLALPITPALLELRHRRDAAALPTQQHDGDIRNFARSFRRYIEPLQPVLATCITAGETRVVQHAGIEAVLVGTPELAPADPERAWSATEPRTRISALVLLGRTTTVRDPMVFTGDLYAAEALRGGAGCVYRAVLGEQNVWLGRASRVLRWIHAEGTLYAECDTELYGRASANQAMYLSSGCSFQRIFAPRICALTQYDCAPELPQAALDLSAPAAGPDSLTGCQSFLVRDRRRLKGRCRIASGESVTANLIAEDDLRIGEDVHVRGSIKGHRDIEIGANTHVEGSIVAMGSIVITGGARILGPVLAERTIVVGPGCQVGESACPTTLSAPRIQLMPGAQVHGTAWARSGGWVGV